MPASRTPKSRRLTPHQEHVLDAVAKWSGLWGSADSDKIGCRRACEKLEAKGFIQSTVVHGPRGGTTWRYKLTQAGARRTGRTT